MASSAGIDVGTTRFALAVVTATGGGLADPDECTWVAGFPFPRFHTLRFKLLDFDHDNGYCYERADARPAALQVKGRPLHRHRALDRSAELDRADPVAKEEPTINGLTTELGQVHCAELHRPLPGVVPLQLPTIVIEPQPEQAQEFHKRSFRPPIMYALQLCVRAVFTTTDAIVFGGGTRPVPRKIKTVQRKLGLRNDGVLSHERRKKMSEITVGLLFRHAGPSEKGARDALAELRRVKMEVDDLCDAWCSAALDAFVESKLIKHRAAAEEKK